MKIRTITHWSFALSLAATLTACSTGQRAQTAKVATRGAASVAEMTGPTQAEILHVLTTVNNEEIEAAKLAKEKSKDPQVISLANAIIKDHTSMNQQAMSLAQRLNIEPDGNEISKSIRAGSMATMASLKNTDDPEFKPAFMNQQLKMHQTAIEAIDNNLIPNASNEELKAFLNKTRSSIASHLNHVQQMQSQSGSSTQ